MSTCMSTCMSTWALYNTLVRSYPKGITKHVDVDKFIPYLYNLFNIYPIYPIFTLHYQVKLLNLFVQNFGCEPLFVIIYCRLLKLPMRHKVHVEANDIYYDTVIVQGTHDSLYMILCFV